MRKLAGSARAPRFGSRWRRRVAAGIVLIMAAVALAAVGRPVAGKVACRIASGHMNACEFGAVERWLGRCERLGLRDYQIDLLRAACSRQLGQTAAWRASLDKAVRNGAPPGAVLSERKLDQIRRGEFQPGAEAEIGQLIEAGASPTDVVAAVALTFRQQPQEAQRLFWKAKAFTDLSSWEIERQLRITTDPRDLAAAQQRTRLTGPEDSPLNNSQPATAMPSGLRRLTKLRRPPSGYSASTAASVMAKRESALRIRSRSTVGVSHRGRATWSTSR
jgi:hypothetical protein